MAEFPVIPGYNVQEELGYGGVATVYKGFEKRLKRIVAIKCLHSHLLKDKNTIKRFIMEAKTAAKLSHSNIVKVLKIGKVSRQYYISMELLKTSLKDKMSRLPNPGIIPKAALDLVEEVFNALDYAHLRGIYHRDIKPDNIMFREDGTVVLADFGIARVLESKKNLTKSGASMGSVLYMSPEQARGSKDVDGRSDIYSLGVVLFEMLTGEVPYREDSQIKTALQHIEAKVPKLPQPLALYQPLIDKMMAKEKKDRLSSGAEFKDLRTQVELPSLTSLRLQLADQLQPHEEKNTGHSTAQQPAAEKKPSDATMLDNFFNISDKWIRLLYEKKLKPFFWKLRNKPVDLTVIFAAIRLKLQHGFEIITSKKDLQEALTTAQEGTAAFLRTLLKGPRPQKIRARIIVAGAMMSIFIVAFLMGGRSNSPEPTSNSPSIFHPIMYQMSIQSKLNWLAISTEEENLEAIVVAIKQATAMKQFPGWGGEQLDDIIDKLEERKTKMQEKFIYHSNRTRDFFKRGDYENAKKEIQQAKKIQYPQALKQLEERIDKMMAK